MSKNTNTLLWVGGGLLAAFALYELMKPQQPVTTIIRTPAQASSSSSAVTAAEVAAGASVLTSIASDLFGDDSGT